MVYPRVVATVAIQESAPTNDAIRTAGIAAATTIYAFLTCRSAIFCPSAGKGENTLFISPISMEATLSKPAMPKNVETDKMITIANEMAADTWDAVEMPYSFIPSTKLINIPDSDTNVEDAPSRGFFAARNASTALLYVVIGRTNVATVYKTTSSTPTTI